MIELKSENQILKNIIKESKLKTINFTNSPTFTASNEISLQTLNDNFHYSYNFLLNNESSHRSFSSTLTKCLITIECVYHQNIIDNTNNENKSEYKLCYIMIDSKLDWKLMDAIICYTFKRYIHNLNSNNTQFVDFNEQSINKYKIGEIERHLNSCNIPEMLPFAYLINDEPKIKIILKSLYLNSYYIQNLREKLIFFC
jgi:hypothetical protein